MLDSVSEQNRKAVSFIERFLTEVPISTQQSIRLYLCKPCFSRVDKARRAAEEAEKTINSLRVQVRGGSPAPVEFIVAAKGDDPEDTPMWSNTRGNATKHRGFPLPVGEITNMYRPLTNSRMARSCSNVGLS